jgi:hypothetical protein
MTTRRTRQAHASANARAIANVAAALRKRWDPAGLLATSTGDRTAEAHAQVLVAMVAAGAGAEQLGE